MIVPPYTACDAEGYFFIYSFNPGFLGRGNSLVLWVEGGVAPYAWSVTGTVFTLDDVQTTDQSNVITCDAGITAEYTETVTVTDACGNEVSGTVCACEYDNTLCCSALDYAFTGDVVGLVFEAGKSYTLTVEGGCPPYKWEALPTQSDYFFDKKYTNVPHNVLNVEDPDRAFYIKVTDRCGTVLGSDSRSNYSLVLSPEDFVAAGSPEHVGDNDACHGPDYEPPNLSPIDENGDYPGHPSLGEEISIWVAEGVGPYMFYVGICGSIVPFGGMITIIPSGSVSIRIDDSETCNGVSMTVSVMDLCGNTDEIYVNIYSCCLADDYVEMTFDDDATVETINPNDDISIHVKDGCEPFHWEVSGTGFSLAEEDTYGQTNTLYAGATACGSANITVKDKCEVEVSFSIRCTAGSWSSIESASCSILNTNACQRGCAEDSCEAAPKEIINGEEKWVLTRPLYGTRCSCEELTWGYGAEVHDHEPPCGSPTSCSEGTCSGDYSPCYGVRWCMFETYTYYVWGC